MDDLFITNNPKAMVYYKNNWNYLTDYVPILGFVG